MEVKNNIEPKEENILMEWKKLPANEAVKVFREVIPNASINVQRERVLFVEGKKVNYEEEEVMFLISSLEGKNNEKLKLAWRTDVGGKGGGVLEFEGKISIAQQKIEGGNGLVLIGEKGVTDDGKKWESIRRFQVKGRQI